MNIIYDIVVSEPTETILKNQYKNRLLHRHCCKRN